MKPWTPHETHACMHQYTCTNDVYYVRALQLHGSIIHVPYLLQPTTCENAHVIISKGMHAMYASEACFST